MASLRLHLILLWHSFFCACWGITCPPGQKSSYHGDICEPCKDNHFQPDRTTSMFCTLCGVCHEDRGSEYVQQCTKEADVKCRCRDGFKPKSEEKEYCQCAEGSGLKKSDLGMQCQECDYGYFTNKPDMQCVKWRDCTPWGVRFHGSNTSDVICNNGSEVRHTSTRSTAETPSYIHSQQTRAGAPTTATSTKPTVTPALSHTTTTTRTTGVNKGSYNSGLTLYLLSLILLIPLSAVSCKQIIIPCMKRHMRKTYKADGACRRPVEECGDRSQSSLVKSSQGIL